MERSAVGMGRRFGRSSMPATVGSAVDDLAVQVANGAYDQLMTRFEADRAIIIDKIVTDATDRVELAIQAITNDSDTMAAIGKTEAAIETKFQNGIIQAVSVGVVVTLLGTFLIVRFGK